MGFGEMSATSIARFCPSPGKTRWSSPSTVSHLRSHGTLGQSDLSRWASRSITHSRWREAVGSPPLQVRPSGGHTSATTRPTVASVPNLGARPNDLTISEKRYRTCPQREVTVIRHQAPGQDRQPVAIPGLAQDLEKVNRLFRLGKKIRSTRESVVDVVDPTLYEYPRPSRRCASSAIQANSLNRWAWHLTPLTAALGW
jgi:hypothetical protein